MKNSDNSPNILILSAVKEELEYLLSNISIFESFFKKNTEFFTGTINQKKITCVVTGPGIVNTAIGLTQAIEFAKPSLIIQTGCAGAFEAAGISNGDIGIASCEIDVHTGIESDEKNDIPLPLPFPIITKGIVDYKNRFPTDINFTEKAVNVVSKACSGRFKVISGPFITVSTITASDKRQNQLYRAYTPCMESMEGAAAAQTALIYDIPFIEIRSASNTVGKRDKSKWDLPLSFKNCNLAVLEFLKSMEQSAEKEGI